MSPARLRLEGAHAAAMERVRRRLMVLVVLFAGAFLTLAVRTAELGLFPSAVEPGHREAAAPSAIGTRADIVDRNGVLLATSLKTHSLFARPDLILDAEEAARRLVQVLPELSEAEVLTRLNGRKSFVYLKRKLTPAQVWAVNALGILGFAFEPEEERVYPQGRLAAHVVGFTDIDGRGLAGIERAFDERLANPARVEEPLRLSVDLRLQHALADEVARAVERYEAIGGGGLLLDVRTGEVLALVSLPDFDPQHRPSSDSPGRPLFNRITQGVYELGSIFKTFTFAMALETGTATLADGYDATDPIRVGRFLIRDDHPQERHLTLPEIFVHSSNIGAAKMALDVGTETQRRFLDALGLLRETAIELPGAARPLVPARWREVETMTIAFGHGLSVSPLHLSTAFAAMVNGGVLRPATLIAQTDRDASEGVRVISEATSTDLRRLLRLAVSMGTGGRADVAGYRVGGKTGTAEKPREGGYAKTALIASFAGVFPIDDPRYGIFVMLDEPQGTEETLRYRTAGWNAAPTVANVVLRIAPMLGVAPAEEGSELYHQLALAIEDRRPPQ